MNYIPARPDWEHQTVAKARMRDKTAFALFMEMGTGKTKTIIDEFCELYQRAKIDTVIVVAKKGTYMNWSRTELPMQIQQELWDNEVVCRVWFQGGGNPRQRQDMYQLLQEGPWLRILTINTEAFSSSEKALAFCEHLLSKSERGAYVVLDESTSIRSPTSKRTKGLIQLAHHRNVLYRRIMTGLPNPRAPLDLFPQAEFLQKGLLGQSFFAFRARYAILKENRWGGRKVVTVEGYKNVEELAERIKPWSYRVLKKDCLDIPDKVYTTLDVELTDEQERLYKEMKKYAIAAIGEGTVSASIVVTQLLRLQQIVCGHVPDDYGNLQDVESNRIEALMDLLDETEGKVVIWSRFRPDVTKICQALQERFPEDAVAQFHGGNTNTRHLESEAFQKDPSVRFMVATYAGGHGNTWTAAHTCVYYSNDFDLELRLQSEDRLHRGGQRNVVTYVDMIARGTVDELILKALRDKIDLSAQVTGDEVRKWLSDV